MSRRGWLLFIAMCLIWGCPYLLIKVAVEELEPSTLVLARTLLGAALLLPFVSPLAAGAALTAFGAGLVNLYLKTPGLTEEDGIRPTQDGIGIAKDVWLVGVGTTLLMNGLVDGTRGAARSARTSAKKSAKKARKNAKALTSS